ncbi:MAG: hypothetical protein M1829_001831 [Trizodia sp. TS-e1964]|nr:MAG: hypothetical protein M1829_001831 [Trizodia sp. TS-e1964]
MIFQGKTMMRTSISRKRWRRLVLAPALFTGLLLWTWVFAWPMGGAQESGSSAVSGETIKQRYPLLWRHVHSKKDNGGAWYIPPHWIPASKAVHASIADAAQAALAASNSSSTRRLAHSSIPLIVHQTWRNTRADTWPESMCSDVEEWLRYSTVSGDESMAYFLWTDEGMLELINKFEPALADVYNALPMPAERADVFRIIVTKWIGGVYADIDTRPLRPPVSWIDDSDLKPWRDPYTYTDNQSTPLSPHRLNPPPPSQAPMRLILGIEGDNDPNTDAYWRMGFNYPVQLTQWALASAPHHPVLNLFLKSFQTTVEEIINPFKNATSSQSQNETSSVSLSMKKELERLDPLSLTGPEAITAATKDFLAKTSRLNWDSLTGLHDGGLSKAVADVLILPITGFRYDLSSPSHTLSRQLTSNPALEKAPSDAWAQNPQQILQRAYGIAARAHGSASISRLKQAKCAARYLDIAGTGPKSPRTWGSSVLAETGLGRDATLFIMFLVLLVFQGSTESDFVALKISCRIYNRLVL